LDAPDGRALFTTEERVVLAGCFGGVNQLAFDAFRDLKVTLNDVSDVS